MASIRRRISSIDTSSMCVAMVQRCPNGSTTVPGAVTVELVFYGLLDFRTGGDGLSRQLIDVLNIERDEHGGSADRLRAERVHLRKFVGQHDGRVADLDFRVHDRAAWAWEAHQLLSAKGAFVEVDRTCGALNDQIRRHGVVTVWDRFCFHKRRMGSQVFDPLRFGEAN